MLDVWLSNDRDVGTRRECIYYVQFATWGQCSYMMLHVKHKDYLSLAKLEHSQWLHSFLFSLAPDFVYFFFFFRCRIIGAVPYISSICRSNDFVPRSLPVHSNPRASKLAIRSSVNALSDFSGFFRVRLMCLQKS